MEVVCVCSEVVEWRVIIRRRGVSAWRVKVNQGVSLFATTINYQNPCSQLPNHTPICPYFILQATKIRTYPYFPDLINEYPKFITPQLSARNPQMS